MKYGKEYADLLKDSRIPQEWKESAIEYRQLKKLIKNVVDELSSMGLNPDVLHKILKPESSPESSGSNTPDGRRGSDVQKQHPPAINVMPEDLKLIQVDDRVLNGKAGEDGEEVEIEFDSDEEPFSEDQLAERLAPERRPSRFRVRLSSHSTFTDDTPRPVFSPDGKSFDDYAVDEAYGDDRLHTHSMPIMPRRTSTARVKAEYVLAGPADHPTPQIRLVLSSSPRSDSPLAHDPVTQPAELSRTSERLDAQPVNRKRSHSLKVHTVAETRVNGSTSRHFETNEEADDDEEDDDDDEDDLPVIHSPSLNKVHALSRSRSDSKTSPEAIIPTSPRLEKVAEVSSPIWALTSGTDSPGMQGLMMSNPGLQDLSLGEPALSHDDDSTGETVATPLDGGLDEHSGDVIELPVRPPAGLDSNQREIIISVPSDVAFFELLCQALNSLSDLHDKQQKLFNEAVRRLCQLISSSIRPSSSSNPIRNLRLPGKRLDKSQFSGPVPTEYSKSDLYAWREIFTLWIEAQIFESSAERNRGERSVEEAEARLKAFAAEVVKRGLGDRRTLKRKESREAWEEFLRLNMLLLDLKRFQLANVNAARKILKKHDKRTALTASVGFPQFVRKSLDAHIDSNGNINSWTFYNTSLPHVLLASLTDTLLPILPSLDDYMCLICTSIAFKPIRLNCSHLFCVRCLAKMQRAGKAHCPLCRATTVLQADRSSLDTEMMGFMQEWFPLEVKKKQKENELEVAKTDVQDMGLNDKVQSANPPVISFLALKSRGSSLEFNMADSEEHRTALQSVIQLLPHHESGEEGKATTEPKEDQAIEHDSSPKTSVLSSSGSKTLTSDMVVALTTNSSSATAQLLPVASVPIRKPTPIPFSDTSASTQLLSTPSSSYNYVYLNTPSPSTPDPASSQRLSAAEQGGSDETPAAGLSKAYSTVLASAILPIGHQSSGSLRHVVMSRTTSSSGVSSINAPGNTNSSQDSFVHISDLEDSPIIKVADDIETLQRSDKPSQHPRAVQDSGVLNPSQFGAEGEFATIKTAAIKRRSKVLNVILKPSSSADAKQTPSADISELQRDYDPEASWIPSLPHSPQQPDKEITEDLAQSYDSAQDPNNMKFWWEAGVRDGDPVGTPPGRSISSLESSGALIADKQQSESLDTRLPLALNDPPKELASWELSRPIGNSAMESVTSDDDVELGREFQQSLSDMFPRNKEFWGTDGSMHVVVEDDDHYSLKSVTNSGNIRMKSVEPFQQSQSALNLQDWNPQLEIINSQEPTPPKPSKSSQEALAGIPMRGAIGILSPEKPTRTHIEPLSAAGVNPSNLHSSYELRSWDPVVNGAYVTFKFLLLMLSNSLRCYSPDLPLHPIVHYIAKFSMVPEDSLRQLFVKELAYATVTDHHITKHDLYLWYRHIFRIAPTTSPGAFHVIIATIIQLTLDLPLEPMERTLPLLQSNPDVVCLLPLGTCRSHRDLDFDALDMEDRPQTPLGSRANVAPSGDLATMTPRGRSGGLENITYNVRDDLELSSSSGSSSPLSSRILPPSSSSDPFISRISRSNNSKALNTMLTPEKGKGKMQILQGCDALEENSSDEALAYIRGASASKSSVVTQSQNSGTSLENSIISDLMFSDSKWNVFNRVIGLLSHTFQIPWNNVLEDPRIVYTMIHDARVSVENFKQWMLNAEGEEVAERETLMMNPGEFRWMAVTDAEGRWSGQSIVSAMFEMLPARYGVKRVADLPPFQRALLHLIRACDDHWMHRPVEETLAFLETFDRYLQYEPWTVGKAARQAVLNLKTHLESPFGSYLAPEARDELKEFVRVQEYQIGSSNKDWQGQEALDTLQTARSMMDS